MDNFKKTIYIPLTKVDDEQRMVYGFASTPDIDSDNEIIEIGAIEKALPEYMKFPTIREMHQPKAAGTTKNASIVTQGDKKGLYIGAKIVSNEAWKLVKEGVYRGFSIGGDVVNRVGNVIKELNLVEISLVDVPANKAAKIEVWKNNTLKQRIAEELLKGVKLNMAKELDEVKKSEGETEEVKTETVETTEEVKTEEVVAEETETKEAGDVVTLTKVDEAVSKVDAVTKAKEDESLIKANESLVKSVGKLADAISKVASKLSSIEDRLAVVEQTPAATKSKTVAVYKNEEHKKESVETVDAPSDEIAAKQARLGEIRKERDRMTPAEFAKSGYSAEVALLYSQLDELAKRQ